MEQKERKYETTKRRQDKEQEGKKGKGEKIEGRNEGKAKERKDEMQVRKQEEKMSKGGEKGRWMIGYPSHPRPPSTNIRVGGIYSYKLSAGAS